MAAVLLGIFIALLIFDGIEATCGKSEKSEKYCDESYSKTFSLDNPATIKELYPFMALIGFKDDYENKTTIVYKCSGILISETYILTAAHCLIAGISELVHVRLGTVNLTSTNNNENTQSINISKAVIHPDYNPSYGYNDIALIELQQSAKLTKDVKPVCLENEKKSYASLITASLGIRGFTEERRNIYKRFYVMEYSNAECRKRYSQPTKFNKGIDEASIICAGSRESESDSCAESGNPLVVIDKDYGYRMVGVATYGPTCGTLDVPIIYFRVSYFIRWIESIVWP